MVVLPAPFGPSSPYTAPRGTASERSRTAVCSEKRLVTCAISMARVAGGVHGGRKVPGRLTEGKMNDREAGAGSR